MSAQLSAPCLHCLRKCLHTVCPNIWYKLSVFLDVLRLNDASDRLAKGITVEQEAGFHDGHLAEAALSTPLPQRLNCLRTRFFGLRFVSQQLK
jgi:hypothetical protein